MQAQEFPFAKWGLALRLQEDVSDADVERAFADGEILRTHVLRPTWHFVTAEDIVWMLELTAPRVHVAMRSYLQHQGLDAKLMVRSLGVIERALASDGHLTRAELGERLARARIRVVAMQLGMITMYAELERLICSGPRLGKAFTYALLAARAPQARRLPPDEALATLTLRFFGSHGPATVKDFVWWSGLRTADARRGIEIARLRSVDRDGLRYWTTADVARARRVRATGAHLLPIYDEYLVAYRDRVAVPHGPGSIVRAGRRVTFRHSLVIDGQVVGTWHLVNDIRRQTVQVTPLRLLSAREQRQVHQAAERYSAYLGTQLQVVVA